jgi:hypothetical protein
MLAVLLKRIRGLYSGKTTERDAYHAALLYDYVANQVAVALKQLPIQSRPDIQAEARGLIDDWIANNPELEGIGRDRLRENQSFLQKERDRLLHNSPQLRAISIYGPALPDALDQLKAEAAVGFRSTFEDVPLECQ